MGQGGGDRRRDAPCAFFLRAEPLGPWSETQGSHPAHSSLGDPPSQVPDVRGALRKWQRVPDRWRAAVEEREQVTLDERQRWVTVMGSVRTLGRGRQLFKPQLS